MTLMPTRWRWRIALAAVVLLIVLIFAHGVWLLVANRRLTAALAALRAAGEPATAADLHLDADPIPDADNASLDYARAASLIDDAAPAWKRFDELSDERHAFTPAWTAAERSAADDLCRADAAALAALAAARGKSAGPWPDHPDPLDMFPPAGTHLSISRRASQLLAAAALIAAADDDPAAAAARLADGVALADAAERRPTLVGHLVAVGMTEVWTTAVTQAMPLVTVTPDARPAVSALLAAVRDERAMRAGSQLAWRTERLAVTRILQDEAAGRFSLSPAGPATVVPHNAPVLYAIRPLLLSDTAAYITHMDGVRRAAARPDWPAARAALPTALPSAIAAHPTVHLAVWMFLIANDKALRTDYAALSNRRLAAVAVAARLFAADHAGRLPTDWPDLVPAYLPAVPTDAMDGRPLRIAADPPRVWSVGNDVTDDGGVPVDWTVRRAKQHGDDVAFFAVQPRPPHAGR